MRDHVSKDLNNESLPVINESVYEQDCSMTEVSIRRSSSKRGLVSRVRDFFESRSLKRKPTKEKSVSRVLNLEQKMSYQEIPFIPQDSTINSTVVTDLDADETFPDNPAPEPIQIPAPVTLKRISIHRQFKCLYQSCSLKFETKMERRKHLETHLNSQGTSVARTKSTWKCKHCDAKFQNPELLLMHEKLHTAQVLHECEKCHKRFKTRTNLAAHQRFHSNGSRQKHKCKICLKEFTHVSTLYVHQIIHKPDVAQALVTFRT